MKLSISIFIWSTISAFALANEVQNFGWEVLDVRMPKKVSDHTASVGSDGLFYIAGGCDSPDGNVYIATSETEGFFTCSSISSSFYAFDPDNVKFQTLTDLPRARYRHSSSAIGNQIWLIGGRDANDVVVPEIDIYDLGSKSWSTVLLPSEYQVSDHAAFTQEPSYVFVAGGYDQNYTALDKLTRIDATTIGNTTLGIQAMAPLLTARGDIYGVTSKDGKWAYITGGFTDKNGFCAPLGTTEQYSFAGDKWSSLPELLNERGEVVLIDIGNDLYALGGERQIEGLCNKAEDVDPGEKTVATDEVEVFDNGAWKVISDFPNHKFRFAGAADRNGLIYAFGGQTTFDNDCQCFRTVDDISIFGQVVPTSAAANFHIMPLIVAGVLLIATLL